MSEITELMARSLTLQELADRLTNHKDPVVAAFAQRVLDAEVWTHEPAAIDITGEF